MTIERIVLAGWLCLLLSGCAGGPLSTRERATLGGAALGAGTGAAIGAIVGGGKGAGTGAAIGAILGTVGGAVTGDLSQGIEQRQAPQGR